MPTALAPCPRRTPTLAALTSGLAAWILGAPIDTVAAPEPSSPATPVSVSYRNDVQAVIAKAGCNLGTCHGNATGKGGFKMSLRGDDIVYDYAALIQEASGRRVNFMEPDRSLLLQKAIQGVAHEGGKRFAKDSWEYNTLRDWIAQGAQLRAEKEIEVTKLEVSPREQILVEPAKTVQIKAIATFSDGSQRDVSKQAVYEPAQVGLVKINHDGFVESLKPGEATIIVRYLNKQQPVRFAFVAARPEFAWSPTRTFNYIDREVFGKLKSLRMNPSEVCDDATFARRVYFDLVGLQPTGTEARQFVEDKSPDKRERLVDKLLARQEFADNWALKWADSLRVEARTMDAKGMTAFHGWIRNAISTNMPVNQFARAILSAQGSTYQVPQTNFYRAMREPNARAEGIARVFLGTRLQCAQCHNHPFDKWTQDDYFNWAAVFSRIDYKILDNKGVDKNDKHAFNGEQIVQLVKEAKFTNPRTGSSAKAKLLGADELSPTVLETKKDLDSAADWITNPNNTLFAQSQVNRIWAYLMGRGLVDPVDDFRATNPATHPVLLKKLADEFVASNYDMRQIIRRIIQSRTYQLSSEPNPTNADDLVNYSHATVRRLTAEQLFDAMHRFTGNRAVFKDFPQYTRASQLPGPLYQRRASAGVNDSQAFLKQFGQPPRLLACDCERTSETTMGQAFSLIGSPAVNRLIQQKSNVLGYYLKSEAPNDRIIQDMFWTALTRPPTAEEQKVLTTLLTSSKDKRATLEDLAWSLLNTKEFVLRR